MQMDKHRDLAHLEQFGSYLSRHPEAVDLFRRRARFIRAFREHLDAAGAVELEMPCLQRYREGAPVHQFVTRHPLTGERFYLRHCMEDHLKRIANSFGMVYELGKAFRAEIEHKYKANEFTVMEFVGMQMSLQRGVELMCNVMQAAIRDAFGTCQLPTVDFSEFRVIAFEAWMTEVLGFGFRDASWREKSIHALAERGVSLNSQLADWEVYEELLKWILEPSVAAPTVVVDYPPALQHVADVDAGRDVALRMSFIANGIEIGDGGVKFAGASGYRAVYAENAEYRQNMMDIPDNDEPEEYYKDIDDYNEQVFSAGIGIDRLFALCAGKGLHEVILFPHH